MEKTIVGFDFDSNDNLYVILDDFRIFKVKIYQKQVKELITEVDSGIGKLTRIKFSNNGFYGLTDKLLFIQVDSFKEPIIKAVEDFSALFPSEDPLDFLQIPASMSTSGEPEILLTHPDNGLYIKRSNEPVQEWNNKAMSEEMKLEVDLFAKIRNIVLSPTSNIIGLYDELGDIYVFDTSLNFDDINKSATGITADDDYQIAWCASNCLVLRKSLSIYLLGPDGKSYAQSLADEKKSKIYIFPEVDGTRILTRKKAKFLLKVDNDTYNTMSEISTEPQRLLLIAYAVFT